jgi:hypothetical protein
MMYWHKLVLLMMSTCCSKHVEAWNKYIEKECVKLVINQNVRRNLLINGGHLETIWRGHCAVTNSWTWSVDGEKRNACRILLGKSLVMCPLGRTRRRWKDNIHMVFRDIWCGWGWIVPCYVLCYVWCLSSGFCRRIDMYLIITFTCR